MALSLSPEQVVAMAPDAASATAGKKLAAPRNWQQLGQNAVALWGACQGSALYQVRVDLSNYGVKCSCPSRKFPCKHGLGLLLLTINSPAAVPASEPPDWVASWIAKRAATLEMKEEKAEKAVKVATMAPAAEREKRFAKRHSLIMNGLDALDLWMNDLVREGLASVEGESPQFWEHQAKRLVDAQAPGVATLLHQMGSIPLATPDWPTRLLERMGRVALLTQAYRQRESFDAALQEDLLQLIGRNLTQDEVTVRGELVEDDWVIVGQRVEEDESQPPMFMQRTWLIGTHSGRAALILQFSRLNTPYKELIVPGIRFQGGLRFYPGSAPLRAAIEARRGESPLIMALPHVLSIDAFLHQQAELLGKLPWQRLRLGLLHQVVPCCGDNGVAWWVRDASDQILPLHGTDHWQLLARSGGAPVDLACEWDGETLRPLGMLAATHFALL